MSTLTIDTSELRKLSFARRVIVRVVNWLKEEYRLTTYAHIRWKAENGDAKAQYTLATLCEVGNGVFRTAPEALKWHQKAAFQGIAPAQLALGLRYLRGQGVTRNEAEALLWLRKAAEQGLPEAQFHLGALYQEGRGAPRDLVQASKWYRKAAESGHSAARKSFKVLNSSHFGPHPTEGHPEKQERLPTLAQESAG